MCIIYIYPHNTYTTPIRLLCIICEIGVCAHVHSDFMNSSCIKLFTNRKVKDTFSISKIHFFLAKRNQT